MKYFVVIMLALSLGNLLNAQVETPPPVEEMIEEEMPQIMEAPDEEIIFEDAEVVEELPYNYNQQNNPRYYYEKTSTELELFYDQYDNTYPKKYGIAKRGKTILPMIFTRSGYYYNNNVAVLGLANQFGVFNLIDEDWDIELKYESIASIGNDLFSVKKNGMYGVVDGNDKIIVDFKWSYIEQISGLPNYLIVTDFSYPSRLRGVYSISENALSVPCQYAQLSWIGNSSEFKVVDGALHNIIDFNNDPKFNTWYENLVLPSGGRKLYIVKVDGKMGIIDDNEQSVVPIEFLDIRTYPFNDGSYLAKNKEGKYGCIMLDGRVSLPFEYTNVNLQYGNAVVAYKDDKCGILQVNNGLPYEITTCEYDGIQGLNQMFVVEKNGKYGLMNTYGEMISKLEYDHIQNLSTNYYDQNKLLVAKKKNKSYLLDNSGKLISDEGYLEIDKLPNGYPINENQYNYLKFKNEKSKVGLLDKLGKLVTPAEFDAINSELNNLMIIENDGKTGVYHILQKEYIVPCEFDNLFGTDFGYIGVKEKSYYKITVRGQVKIVRFE